MKQTKLILQNSCALHVTRRKDSARAVRRGSALMIVIVLLGMLAFLGVIFYTFAAQERENADFFAQAAKETPEPDDLFDFALEQLIVGPPNYIPQSALWGRRHSIVANMVGRLDPRSGRPADLNPFSGDGVHVIDGGSGVPAIDENYNGLPDDGTGVEPDNRILLQFSDSPAAWGILNPTKPMRPGFFELPEPDVDYTYPDINNLFLAYNGYGLDSGGNPVRVIIPSFHRPQYLRDGSGAIPNWQRDSTLPARLMRPHPDHVAFDARGRVALDASNKPIRRFLDDNNAADATLISSLPGSSGGFPFDVDDDGDGTNNEQGVWDGNAVWEYDVDNDGDSNKEGVWLDLGYPIQEDPETGAKYVPLVSFTVYDADGLLNLNIHGNLNGDINLANNSFGGSGAPGTRQFTSKSNLGLSPAEVNPLWALSKNPNASSSPLDQLTRFFGHAPATTDEAANMEWWFLNMGRGELQVNRPPSSSGNQSVLTRTDIDDLFSGRWGDMNYLFGGLVSGVDPNQNGNNSDAYDFARPGRWNADDNANQNQGGARGDILPFVQPLDFAGTGSFTTGPQGKTPDLFRALGASNPCVWLRYSNYGLAGIPVWAFGPDGQPGQAGVDDDGANGVDDIGELGWSGSDDDDLVKTPYLNALLDDPMELTVEPNKADRPIDEPFTADEMAFLHLTNTDLTANGITGRLQSLVPFNFDPSDVTGEAEKIRNRFTTMSWDRKSPCRPLTYIFGPDGQPGKAGVDDDGDDNVDRLQDGTPDFGELGSPGSDDVRGWEFNADSDFVVDQENGSIVWRPDGNLEFPPVFGGVSPFDQADAFRPELRRLLTMELGDNQELRRPAKLSLNGVLDVLRRPDVTANELTDRLIFRRLTPHATDPSLSNIPSSQPLYDPANWTSGQQEWWARYDRQRMAHDIYVLLYTVGGNNDTEVTDYSAPQKKEMAQFAVNLIDALDPDDVITVFEYDTDLSTDGWNLDDDPTTADVLTQRDVVYGVESQILAFSELLWVRAESGQDEPQTLFDDSSEKDFLFIELRNALPQKVSLNTSSTATPPNIDKCTWRISIWDDTNLDGKIDRPSEITQAFGFWKSNPDVSPGDLFTIGCGDDFGGGQRAADLFVDHDGDGYFDLIVPRDSSANPIQQTTPPPAPYTSLDLIYNYSGPDRYAVLGSGTGPNFFSSSTVSGKTSVTLLLERRANVSLPDLDTTNENPWVVVDQNPVNLSQPSLWEKDISVTPPVYRLRLDQLKSLERYQVLSDATDDFNGATTPPEKHNSFNQKNSRSPNPFTVWQPHFDRDFASPIELLSLPLFAPQQLLQKLSDNNNANAKLDSANTAAHRFLQPYDPSGTNPFHNRWYRLFETVETPTRTHEQLGDPLKLSRVPGKINLNTLRHPEVLAALLDDQSVFTVDSDVDQNTGDNAFLVDSVDNRDWWRKLIEARDGARLLTTPGETYADPVTGFWLPGIAGAEPFRSFGFVPPATSPDPSIREDQITNLLENSLLRLLPNDGLNGRRLFELGAKTEHDNADVDYYTRNRLLSKIWNNVTTRSNVFYAFVTIRSFEAIEVPTKSNTTAVRVGGELKDGTGKYVVDQRGFFVIDRSAIEEAYDPNTRKFNWRALVKYRLKIN